MTRNRLYRWFGETEELYWLQASPLTVIFYNAYFFGKIFGGMQLEFVVFLEDKAKTVGIFAQL